MLDSENVAFSGSDRFFFRRAAQYQHQRYEHEFDWIQRDRAAVLRPVLQDGSHGKWTNGAVLLQSGIRCRHQLSGDGLQPRCEETTTDATTGSGHQWQTDFSSCVKRMARRLIPVTGISTSMPMGYLVDPASGARVAGMTAAGQLTDINIVDLARSPAKATSQINLSGTLNRAGCLPVRRRP